MAPLAKKIIFSLTPAALLLLLLVVAEAVLRIAAPEDVPRLIKDITYDGFEWRQINRSYLEKYFPANAVLIPEFKSGIVRKAKQHRSLRVLCLGESSMFGTPYQMAATIPSIVRKQLRKRLPQTDVEVLNLGASAINTNVLRDITPDLLTLDPDIVLIYTGHNEFYGPDGIGASFLERRMPALTRWKYRLRDLRLVQLVQSALRSRAEKARTGTEANMMKEVSQESRVALASPDARRIFDIFEENLRSIISSFRKAGVPVLVSEVASNLEFPPFAAADRPEFSSIDSALRVGSVSEAERLARTSIRADSINARTLFFLGRCLLARGDADLARRALAQARDEDLLKFRAPEEINRIIRRVCAVMSVPCLPADSALAAASPAGIPGNTLFWEHLHPRLEGYYKIADLFLRQVPSVLPTQPWGNPIPPLPCDADSLAIPWLDRAYADLSMAALTSRWPFSDFHVRPVVLDSADERLKHIVQEVYTKRMSWDEGCLGSADRFKNTGRPQAALTTYRAMLEEYPRAYYVHYLCGTLFRDAGDLTRAGSSYAAAIAINPEYPFARSDLALLRINEGRLEEADTLLARAWVIVRGTSSVPVSLKATICYGRAAVDANRGRYGDALRSADQALSFVPSYAPAQKLRRQLQQAIAGKGP